MSYLAKAHSRMVLMSPQYCPSKTIIDNIFLILLFRLLSFYFMSVVNIIIVLMPMILKFKYQYNCNLNDNDILV